MSDADQRESRPMPPFENTAVKLSQGPLGIIALFIVLIHGFASLALGLAADIGETNQSILVWFLVSFPVVVFFVFAWLVSCHHLKLYPPQAFRDEAFFLRSAGIPYGQAGIDNPDTRAHSAKPPASASRSLDSNATGSLYWLGHDLMWTADALLRRGPPEDVLVGIAQARHHLTQVGLQGTPIEGEIRALYELIRQSGELTPSLRDSCASQLGSVIDRIGMAAEAAQPNFEEPPHWKRVRS
jgi:hypothetical protein